eukprot:XP_001951644.2 PREDICTED: WD and tetratricopeptide repeats protein 1-like [Acyrthosiphon pisum]
MSSATSMNILQLIRNRELNDRIRTKYALKRNMDYKCISKLGLLAQLEGHRGEVNCLQWNASGSTLASASGDHQIILWDPFLQKVKTTIKISDRNRIFSVKFIPGCNDDIVAAGCGWSSYTYDVTTSKKLSCCVCSDGNIRRLAVANDSPSVYWCASEEGCISQHDTRISHECSTDKSKTTLVKIYGNLGTKISAKCLDINKLRTEQLAVGASDKYVRLYDRRKIQSVSSFDVKHLSEYDGNNINSALQYFVPGHTCLNDNETKKKKNNIITNLAFSHDGQELLVNYSCEYVYLYDLVNRVDNAFFNIPKVMNVPREFSEGSSTDLIDDQVPVPHLTLPHNVVQLKLKANDFYEEKEYTSAIVLYSEAINIHKCSELLLNRAAAYIKRKWHGDSYAALKDCVTALQLEPNHMEAHFQLAVSLFELDKLKDSKMYLDQFALNYPSYKTSAAYKCLYSDLLNALSNNKDKFDGKKFLETLDTTLNVLDVLCIKEDRKITFEKYFCNQAKDFKQRYIGHCNYFTDDKEAHFFGSQSQFIVAGSDDGLIYVWEKNTEKNLLLLKGDSTIVNCIQPHPSEFFLATSGSDLEVRLWSPLPDDVDNTTIRMNDYGRRSKMNMGSTNSCNLLASIVKLSPLKIPEFSGNYKDWSAFKDIFTIMVHSNENVPEVQKLFYLKATLSGDAAEVVKYFETSANNYQIACECLNERFNNKRIIVQAHIKAIFNLEKITEESSEKLRLFVDKLFDHIKTPEAIGYKPMSWDLMLLHFISTKLDNTTLREWETQAPKTEVPKVEELIAFLKSRFQVLESIENAQSFNKVTNGLS